VGRAKVWLGHRRLSIIDVEGSAQPLANEDGTVWITFNGEIYNYAELRAALQSRHCLRTAGDTEVLVHLWEDRSEHMIQPLVGMFAFALYDARRDLLLLARDRFGKKPLYYWHGPAGLAFASELQALWEVEGFPIDELDPAAVAQYFRYGYVPGPRTIYRGVWSLPPGHLALVRNGRVELIEYWRPRVCGESWSGGLDEIETLLDDAVRLRLNADVPLGAFLSGGIDSGLVVASMVRQRDRVNTFSIAMPEARLNESAEAASTAMHLHTVHHTFEVQPDVVGVAERLARHYGQPFADYSAIPTYYVSREARSQVKVALTGDGGDELFAGYERYVNYRWTRLAAMLPAWPRRCVAGLARRTFGQADLGGRIAEYLASAAALPEKGERHSSLFHPQWQDRCFEAGFKHVLREASNSDLDRFSQLYREAVSPHPLERWLEVDQRLYLADDILTKLDVASMAVSLECRAPLLDHRLAERVNRLPLAAKIRAGQTKRVLRALARRRLPERILAVPKRGFTMPLADWLRHELRDYSVGLLFEGSRPWEPYLAAQSLRRLWEAHQSGREDHSMRLWTVIAWCHWHAHTRAAR